VVKEEPVVVKEEPVVVKEEPVVVKEEPVVVKEEPVVVLNTEANDSDQEESTKDTDSIQSFPESDSNTEDSVKDDSSYPGELADTISSYVNNLDSTEFAVRLCVFYLDKEHRFVKYIVKIENQEAVFPNFNQDIAIDGNSKIENEEDTKLETEFKTKCETGVNAMFSAPPKFTYRGFIPDNEKTQLFAFFEIEDADYVLAKNHLNSIVDELDFLKKVAGVPVSENIFEANSDLRYYDVDQVSPPHCGTAVKDMDLFKNGKYFEVGGSGNERYAFFTKTTVYLLSNDMIEAFQKRPDDQKTIDYDSIFFRKGGKDFWFLSDTVETVLI
jgi:hypothetical protein